MDIIGSKYILNSNVYCVKNFQKNYKYDVNNVYEVVRVVNGQIIFWEEHLQRLNNSIYSSIDKYINLEHIFSDIHKVIELNYIKFGNIKIEIIFISELVYNVYLYLIEFYYPSNHDILSGVDVLTLKKERINPTIKYFDYEFRKEINNIIKSKNIYEVLLVNKENFITEGSRTNVYFLKDDIFFTAPKNLVLNGVTRINVNKIIQECGFSLIEKCISIYEINEYDGCFLTSTSSNVLPVSFINNIMLNSSQNYNILKVMKLFRENLEKKIK